MAYQLRQVNLPLLPAGAKDIRILHFSDLHLTPRKKREIAFIKSWAELEPDLVISTGDFLAHTEAVPFVLEALDELLSIPGLFVFGSNDYFSPSVKNPFKYLMSDTGIRKYGEALPWQDLDNGLQAKGWINLNQKKRLIEIKGLLFEVRGTDDAHLFLDNYYEVSGLPHQKSHLAIGITHAPYKRVLEGMQADKLQVIFAGHTHGGQIRFPWFSGSRALTTNCDLPTWRARGLSKLGEESWLNVSAGVGTSPFAPIRLFCPPEISLLTLTSCIGKPSQSDSL
jgi:predicted MPP superfamily phosphohydrolase